MGSDKLDVDAYLARIGYQGELSESRQVRVDEPEVLAGTFGIELEPATRPASRARGLRLTGSVGLGATGSLGASNC